MVDGWNIRLREARRKKGIPLKEAQKMSKLDVSQQSLIKYEKGEVFPRIDLLEKMCKLYGVTVDYVLYGESEFAPFEDRASSLVTLFMLLYSNKIRFDRKNGKIEISDPRLKLQIAALDYYREEADFSSLDDLERLIQGIKKMEEEQRRSI